MPAPKCPFCGAQLSRPWDEHEKCPNCDAPTDGWPERVERESDKQTS